VEIGADGTGRTWLARGRGRGRWLIGAPPSLLHPHLDTSQAVSLARPHTDGTVVAWVTIERTMPTSTPTALDGTAVKAWRG
jgi:hypothetical protein